MVKRNRRSIASLSLVLALSLAGCGKEKPDVWKAVVVPKDPVISECRDDPPPKPRPAARAYNGDDAARAYHQLDKHDDAVVRQWKRCSTWAKGQR